jgi:hypothetical protein
MSDDPRISRTAREYFARLAAHQMPDRLHEIAARVALERPRRHFTRVSFAVLTSVCVALVVALPLLLVSGHLPGESKGHPAAAVSPAASPRATASPVPGLPCALQPGALLTLADMPAHLVVESPPEGRVGPLGLLDNGDAYYPGYVGHSYASFDWSGFLSGPSGAAGRQSSPSIPATGPLYSSSPGQVLQVAEQVSDFGSLTNAQRWMTVQHQCNQPNDIPNTNNGVERDATVPRLGDDTLVYQLDDGAPPSFKPFTGPFVGHVYTDIVVRQGDLIFAIGIDSGPNIDAVSLAQSLIINLLAKDAAMCG